MARTTSSPSLAPRLPMTSEAPALAIAKAVALPMPVPPPVTMPTLSAKDAMSPPEQDGHDDQVASIRHEKTSVQGPRRRIRGIPSLLLCQRSPRGRTAAGKECGAEPSRLGNSRMRKGGFPTDRVWRKFELRWRSSSAVRDDGSTR